MSRSRRLLLTILAVGALLAAGCGDDDGFDAEEPSPSTSESPAPDTGSDEEAPVEEEPADEVEANGEEADEDAEAEAEPEVLQILVTNDDGYDSTGIDELVTGLAALPDTEVVVVAPATNQSGTSDTTSDAPPAGTEAATTSGHPALAIEGTPADSVLHALGELALEPHLVVSGINDGQNIGEFTFLSGTVGAARTAVRNGFPALALSAALLEPDYAPAVTYAVDWVTENREVLLDRTAELIVISVNVPTCPDGELDGIAEVPFAESFAGRDPLAPGCELDVDDPVDDVDAFLAGFISVSEVPADR